MGKKVKVLLVVRWPVGGIRTFIRYVYRNFNHDRWQFTILAPDLAETHSMMSDLSGLNVKFAPISSMPMDGSAGFRIMFCAVKAELMKRNYDLIHSHGFISGVSAAIPAAIGRIPHMMTSHGVLREDQFSGITGGVKKKVMGRLFSMIDTIQSVSYDAQKNFISYFPELIHRKVRLVVVPSGVEVDRFRRAKAKNFKKELSLSEDAYLIGFFGRFMFPKGFRFLVNAIEMLLQDRRLCKRPLVLAYGEGGYIREEIQEINKRRLQEFFYFMPFTPNIAGSLKGLDVVVMPSLWEACGLLAMEAMVAGVPIIGTDCIGLREILKNTPARSVPVKDSSAIAEAILQEMQTPSRKPIEAFAEKAAVRFDVARRAAEIEELMEMHIGNK